MIETRKDRQRTKVSLQLKEMSKTLHGCYYTVQTTIKFSGSHGERALARLKQSSLYVSLAYMKRIGFAGRIFNPSDMVRLTIHRYATKIVVYARLYHPHIKSDYRLLYEVVVSFLDETFPIGNKLKKVLNK